METPTWKAMLVAGLVSSSIFTGLFYLFLWRIGA